MVDALKAVDYTFITELHTGDRSPLDVLERIFLLLKPDRYIINLDAFSIEYRKELCNQYAVEIIILDRWCPPEFENVSSTSIITKLFNQL